MWEWTLVLHLIPGIGYCNSFIAISLLINKFFHPKALQHLTSDSSPCHIPALKVLSNSAPVLFTFVLLIMCRRNAPGISLSTSPKGEVPFLNTLQPELVCPYGHCGLTIQITMICSKHSASQPSSIFWNILHFSEILSPLSPSKCTITREAVSLSRRPTC